MPTTITLHHKGKITCASFTYSTNTSALPKNKLHREGNLTHASFHSIVKENTRTSLLPTTTLHRKGKHKCIGINNYIVSWRKLARVSFPYSTSTSALPKSKLHHEINIKHPSFHSIVSKSTRKIHFQQLCSIAKIHTSALQKTTILHHGQKITRVSFHYSNKISELPKTTLQQHKWIAKKKHCNNTSELPKTTL